MKVLMISNNYIDKTRGGVELHVYNLAHALVLDGHEVHVARTSPGRGVHAVNDIVPLRAVLEDTHESERGVSGRFRKLKVLRFAGNFLTRVTTAVRAAKRLRADPEYLRSFDVVHHHDFITSVIMSRLIGRLAKTQVWTNHLGEFLIMRRIPIVGHLITRVLTRSFKGAVGPSAELADQSTVSCPIEYIPNGVNTELFAPLSFEGKMAARKVLGWEADRIIAIVPRRWAPTKGVIFAAEAMSAPQWPKNCDVVFAGAGESDFPEYSAEIRKVLEVSPITYRTIDSLSMEAMALAIQGADLCIIPSLMEATSLSALEAMSAGLPVIGTRVGGLPEIIEDGVNGHLVPAMDPGAIASSCAALSRLTPAERQAIGEASRQRVSAVYSWRAISLKTMAVYRKAMA